MLDVGHLGTQRAWPGILHRLASVMGLLQISLTMPALSRLSRLPREAGDRAGRRQAAHRADVFGGQLWVTQQAISTCSVRRCCGTSGASPAQTTQALGLIASRAVPVTDLITHHLPLAQFASALTTKRSGQAIEVTIEP
jgi:hypothetical protein